MEIKPILSTLMRNKTGPILIALQIALTMAVIINAVFIILDRAQTMAKPIGIDSAQLITVRIAPMGEVDDVRARAEEDLRVLNAIDGVINATKISTFPLSNSGSSSTFTNSTDDNAPSFSVAYYYGDQHLPETLGLELVSGRWLRAEDIVYDPAPGATAPQVVLAHPLAKKMFPDTDPVGQYMYNGLGEGIEIVGTYKMLSRPWYTWGDFYDTGVMGFVERNFHYAVRVEPGRVNELLTVVEEELAAVDPDRLVADPEPHTEMVKRTYQRDVAMNRMLTIVMVLVVLITALGIVGLASFSVTQRRRQIGTRRAVGAQRFHILRYFMVENWLITTGGIALGVALSFAINYHLVQNHNLAKLDPLYVPLVVFGLWGVGLLATLGPARSAMQIDPAIATRNV